MTMRCNAAGLAATVVGAACLLAMPMLAAQDDIVPPEPISTPMPEPPANPFGGPRREGWVMLRYSVLADGTTANVRMVDVIPPGTNTEASVSAVEQWTFDPATDAGQAIDWHNNVTVIAFSGNEVPQEATPMFAEAYEEVGELMREERFSRAKSRNERMQRDLAFRLYEMGLAQVQLAALELALEDPHAALAAIRRATEPSVRQLSNEELGTALEYRFAIEVQLGRVTDALETYARRAALGSLSADNPVEQQANAIQQALQNQETVLAIQARIDRGEPWAHELTRRTFAVGELDGRIQEIEVECNRNRVVLPFEEEVEVTIPDGWGDCALFFNGRRNTTFTLYEFN